MHRRDQAWQAWIIPGVVKEVANNRPKERGREHHAIVRLFQLRRQIDREMLRTQSIQRFRIGIGEVREQRSGACGVNGESPEKGLARPREWSGGAEPDRADKRSQGQEFAPSMDAPPRESWRLSFHRI